MPIFLPLHTSFASNRPHHKIPDSEPTTPTPKKTYLQNTNLIRNNGFKTLSINQHYFNALLNLSPNSFPLKFSVHCSINVCKSDKCSLIQSNHANHPNAV
jgi:hypothetical protein